jgi:hypothetical protein
MMMTITRNAQIRGRIDGMIQEQQRSSNMEKANSDLKRRVLLELWQSMGCKPFVAVVSLVSGSLSMLSNLLTLHNRFSSTSLVLDPQIHQSSKTKQANSRRVRKTTRERDGMDKGEEGSLLIARYAAMALITP